MSWSVKGLLNICGHLIKLDMKSFSLILLTFVMTWILPCLPSSLMACEFHDPYEIIALPQSYWQGQNEIKISGRLIKKEEEETKFQPKSLMSVSEIKSSQLIAYAKDLQSYLWLKTDDEGFYSAEIPSPLITQWLTKSIKEKALVPLQSLSFEIYVIDLEDDDLEAEIDRLDRIATTKNQLKTNQFLKADHLNFTKLCLVGTQSLRFRALENAQKQPMIAIRSDIDLTYLETDFHSKLALLELLATESKDRKHVKGMDQMMRYLQALNRFSFVFLSGSPSFFQKHLLERFRLDKVDLDGLYLKDFKKILKDKFLDFEWFSMISALKAQIFYKLNLLFRLRQQLPSHMQEILFGDDSEADHVVYDLYQKTMSRQITLAELKQDLIAYELSSEEIIEVLDHASLALKSISLDLKDPILAIYIHLTDRPNQKYLTSNLQKTKIRFHQKTKEIIQDLIDRQLISAENLKAYCQTNPCIDLGI
jgi:hypothetical protein